MCGRRACVSVRVCVPRGKVGQGRARPPPPGSSDCLPGWKVAWEEGCARDRVWSQLWCRVTTWATCGTFLGARGKGDLRFHDHREA